MIENLIKWKEGESAIVTLTKKRLKNNLNLFSMFTGKLGSGKSWSAISFAQELDPEFDIEKQVTFDFRETMTLINSDWFKGKKIKIIVWDEPQITISNRAWQSQLNRLCNYLVTTFRHLGIVLILATPYKDFLDSQTMKLVQWVFECSRIDRKTNQCLVYPKYQQYNPNTKKTYVHPLYVIRNGKRRVMRVWKIKRPSKDSIKIYEDKKVEFTTNLNKSIQEKLEQMETPKKLLLTEGEDDIIELWNRFNGEVKKIAEFTGTSVQNVYKTYRKAKMKQLNRNKS